MRKVLFSWRVTSAVLVALLVALVGAVPGVYAANITYNADVKLDLPSNLPPAYMWVLSGSGADSLVVNPASVVVTIPTSTLFSIFAPYQILIEGAATGGTINQTCPADRSQHTVTIPASNPVTQSLTLTLSPNKCGEPSSNPPPLAPSSGGTVSAPPPTVTASSTATSTPPITTTPTVPLTPEEQRAALIASLQAQIQQLLAQIAAMRSGAGVSVGAGTVAGGERPSYRFTRPLAYGARGADVTALQQFLKSEGADIYPEGIVSGWFGQLTKKAIARWQVRQGIVPSLSDAYAGVFGPKTRAAVNALTAP